MLIAAAHCVEGITGGGALPIMRANCRGDVTRTTVVQQAITNGDTPERRGSHSSRQGGCLTRLGADVIAQCPHVMNEEVREWVESEVTRNPVGGIGWRVERSPDVAPAATRRVEKRTAARGCAGIAAIGRITRFATGWFGITADAPWGKTGKSHLAAVNNRAARST